MAVATPLCSFVCLISLDLPADWLRKLVVAGVPHPTKEREEGPLVLN